MNGRSIIAVGIVAIAGLAAACSSSGNQAGGSSSASTTALKGNPIQIVSIASVTGPIVEQGIPDSLKAAVDNVNASGGIDGRPLQVTVCDDQGTSDGALACARDATQNKSVIASVGGVSAPGAGYGQALSKAGIPMIGEFPSASWELTTPGVYPLTTGTIGALMGVSALLKQDGLKRPVSLRPAISQAAVVPQLLDAGPVPLVGDVAIPVDATDLAPYVTSALSRKPDAVVITLQDPQQSQAVQAIYQQGGGKVKVLIDADGFTAAQLTALGPAQSIVLGILSLPPSSDTKVAAVAQWRADMARYAGSDTALTTLSENADLSVHVFANVASGLVKAGQPLTRQSIVSALKSEPSINTYGGTGPINFRAPAKGLPFPLPNVYAVSVWYVNAADNTWQVDGNRDDLIAAG